MSKIERAGRAQFKRIAAGRDVLHMELGGTINETAHGSAVKARELAGLLFQRGEIRGVTNAGHFDRFAVARPFIPGRKRAQKGKVIDYRGGNGKCADKILLAKGIDAVLNHDARWWRQIRPRPAARRPPPPTDRNGGRCRDGRCAIGFQKRENKNS